MAKSIINSKDDPGGGNSGQVTPKLKFWIDLAKWFIVSVALVVTTLIIDTGFKERAADLTELKFYDKYITELTVLNSNPANKIMLAEYLLCISPSIDLRKRWKAYYDTIYPDYIKYITPIREELNLIDERLRHLALMDNPTAVKSDELKILEKLRVVLYQQLYPSFALPEEDYLH